MSKKAGKVHIKLSDYKERKAEEGAIYVDLDDGSTFRIPPPDVWPDEFYKKVRTDDDFAKDEEAQARMLVGDDDFDRFLANGGTVRLFHSLVTDDHGADVGESQPSPNS